MVVRYSEYFTSITVCDFYIMILEISSYFFFQKRAKVFTKTYHMDIISFDSLLSIWWS